MLDAARRVSLALIACLPSLATWGAAQTEPPPAATPAAASLEQAPAEPQGPPLDATTQQALERLAAALTARRASRLEAMARGDTVAVAELDRELQTLGWQFANLSTRLDVQEFEEPSAGSFDLETELEELLRPLLQALKETTAEPRQINELKRQIESRQARQRVAEQALRQAERTRDALPRGSEARAEAERELRERWTPTVQELRREVLVLQARLDARTESQPSLFDSVSNAIRKFLENSGLNLLLAAGVFFVTFGALRWLRRRIVKRLVHGRTFAHRLFDVLAQALIVLVAVAATMVVPYARNDWLLLAVGIVFLIGVGWLAVRTAPQLFEQVRMLLNVGAVREGERIVLDGLPYRVVSLRLYARLDNPDLQGGSLRLPVRDLVGKHSRPTSDAEPWFPSRTGDVVQLADGVFGPVLVQTPQTVVVQDYGAERSYATAEYLAQRPRNLSRGFAVETTFGLDYALVEHATTTVPGVLQRGLDAGLRARLPQGQVVEVQVMFRAAGSSSLDFQAVATFTGDAAPRFLELRAAVQELLVATATRQGWTIPFPQLTVHRGPSAAG